MTPAGDFVIIYHLGGGGFAEGHADEEVLVAPGVVATAGAVKTGGDMGYIDATQNLKKCFSMDEKYIKIAETDGDLDEDMVASTIDEYLEEKKMTAELNAQMEEQRKAEEAEAAKKAAEEAAAAAELEAAQKAMEEEAAKKKAAEEAAAKKAPAKKAPVKRTTTAKKK